MTNCESYDAMCCEACGSEPLEDFVVPGRASLLFCPKCNLYQKGKVTNRPLYPLYYHSHYIHNSQRKLRKAVVRLRSIAALFHRPTGLRLLDIGCSVGFTVRAAQEMGWEACGVDVSEDAVAEARNHGLDCQTVAGLGLPFPDEHFDAVTAWHVIEHVESVSHTLHEWRRVLKPGGILGLETPDASSRKVKRLRERYSRFWKPEHVYVFSPQNLQGFLLQAGFVISPPRISWLFKARDCQLRLTGSNHGFLSC